MEPVLLEAGFPPPPVARGRTLQSPQNHRSRSGGAGQPIKQEKVSTGQPRYSPSIFCETCGQDTDGVMITESLIMM